jgi:hypothetical protein
MDSGQEKDDDESSTQSECKVSEILSTNVNHWTRANNELSLLNNSATPYEVSELTQRGSQVVGELSQFTSNPSEHLLNLVNQAFGEDSNIDLPAYVKEHNTTLTFPEKVSCNYLHI